MVAMTDDHELAADMVRLVCDRYPIPDPYTLYLVDVVVRLLNLDSTREIQQFFDRAGVDAVVVAVPCPSGKKEDEL